MITTLILTLLALLGGLSPALQLEPDGAPWRIVTCHFTHWTYEQLAWDVLALFALGVACERRNRAAFHATLLASAITIPLAVLAFAPEVTAYRGLSGIDSALFALLLLECGGASRRFPTREQSSRAPVALLAIAFIAKLAFELSTGSTLFVTNMGDGVSPVPVAHLAGALTALAIAMLRKRALVLAPLVFASCISANNPVRVQSCAPRNVAGTWWDWRTTMLGPVWVSMSLGCDCRYTFHGQFLFIHTIDRGSYLNDGKTIQFLKKHGPWRMPYWIDGSRMTVEEHPGERHVYTRVTCESCSPCSWR